MNRETRSKPGVGRGNGKTVLLGEHAVVYGMPAIAAGISLGATARAEPSDVSSIRIAERVARSADGSDLAAALDQTCQVLGAGPHRLCASSPDCRNVRRAASPQGQSRSEALTGTMGARRAWTASMISALSMPWR